MNHGLRKAYQATCGQNAQLRDRLAESRRTLWALLHNAGGYIDVPKELIEKIPEQKDIHFDTRINADETTVRVGLKGVKEKPSTTA
jgi:hypothetical protein